MFYLLNAISLKEFWIARLSAGFFVSEDDFPSLVQSLRTVAGEYK